MFTCNHVQHTHEKVTVVMDLTSDIITLSSQNSELYLILRRYYVHQTTDFQETETAAFMQRFMQLQVRFT
jgi:hypothetical protein